MAQGFDIVVRLQAQTGNFRPVIQDIKNQLQGFTANVNAGVNPAAVRSINATTQSFDQLKGIVNSVNDTIGKGSFQVAAKDMQSLKKATQGVIGAATALQNSISLKSGTKSINEASNAMFKLGQQAVLSGSRFAAFSIGALSFVRLSSAIHSAGAEAIEFQRNMVRLSQLGAVSNREIAETAENITKLSTSLGASSKELANASIYLKGAGLSIDEVNSALTALAKTSLAPTFKDIKSTTEGLLSLRAQFKLTGKDYEGVLGSINAVAKDFAAESEDIIEAVRRSGAAFKAASGDLQSPKKSLNEFIALFTSVRATTRESSESIATSFRTIFARLQSNDVVKNLHEMGVELRYTADEAKIAGQNIEGQFIGGFKAINRISAALKGVPTTDPRFAAIVNQIGGVRQVSKVIPLLQQTAVAQKAYSAAIAGTTSLDRDATKASDALSVRLDKLRESFSSLVREVVQSKAFSNVIDGFTAMATAATTVVHALTPMLPLLTSIAAIKLGFGAASFTRGVFAGPAKRFHAGGKVTGGHGASHSDSVPMMAPHGAFVIRKPVASRLSRQAVSYLTSNDRSSGGQMVPIRVMPGEIIVPPKTAARHAGALHRINKGYASGGQVLSSFHARDNKVRSLLFHNNYQKMLLGPHASQIAQHLPEGSKFLTHGTDAAVFDTGDGHVLRIGGIGKDGGYRHSNAKNRPVHPMMLQAVHRQEIGPYVVEKLPKVTPLGDTDNESPKAKRIVRAFANRLIKKGKDPLMGELHLGNLARVNKRIVAIDPEVFKDPMSWTGSGSSGYGADKSTLDRYGPTLERQRSTGGFVGRSTSIRLGASVGSAKLFSQPRSKKYNGFAGGGFVGGAFSDSLDPTLQKKFEFFQKMYQQKYPDMTMEELYSLFASDPQTSMLAPKGQKSLTVDELESRIKKRNEPKKVAVAQTPTVPQMSPATPVVPVVSTTTPVANATETAKPKRRIGTQGPVVTKFVGADTKKHEEELSRGFNRDVKLGIDVGQWNAGDDKPTYTTNVEKYDPLGHVSKANVASDIIKSQKSPEQIAKEAEYAEQLRIASSAKVSAGAKPLQSSTTASPESLVALENRGVGYITEKIPEISKRAFRYPEHLQGDIEKISQYKALMDSSDPDMSRPKREHAMRSLPEYVHLATLPPESEEPMSEQRARAILFHGGDPSERKQGRRAASYGKQVAATTNESGDLVTQQLDTDKRRNSHQSIHMAEAREPSARELEIQQHYRDLLTQGMPEDKIPFHLFQSGKLSKEEYEAGRDAIAAKDTHPDINKIVGDKYTGGLSEVEAFRAQFHPESKVNEKGEQPRVIKDLATAAREAAKSGNYSFIPKTANEKSPGYAEARHKAVSQILYGHLAHHGIYVGDQDFNERLGRYDAPVYGAPKPERPTLVQPTKPQLSPDMPKPFLPTPMQDEFSKLGYGGIDFSKVANKFEAVPEIRTSKGDVHDTASGIYIPETRTARVRSTLPQTLQNQTGFHELFHALDEKEGAKAVGVSGLKTASEIPGTVFHTAALAGLKATDPKVIEHYRTKYGLNDNELMTEGLAFAAKQHYAYHQAKALGDDVDSPISKFQTPESIASRQAFEPVLEYAKQNYGSGQGPLVRAGDVAHAKAKILGQERNVATSPEHQRIAGLIQGIAASGGTQQNTNAIVSATTHPLLTDAERANPNINHNATQSYRESQVKNEVKRYIPSGKTTPGGVPLLIPNPDHPANQVKTNVPIQPVAPPVTPKKEEDPKRGPGRPRKDGSAPGSPRPRMGGFSDGCCEKIVRAVNEVRDAVKALSSGGNSPAKDKGTSVPAVKVEKDKDKKKKSKKVQGTDSSFLDGGPVRPVTPSVTPDDDKNFSYPVVGQYTERGVYDNAHDRYHISGHVANPLPVTPQIAPIVPGHGIDLGVLSSGQQVHDAHGNRNEANADFLSGRPASPKPVVVPPIAHLDDDGTYHVHGIGRPSRINLTPEQEEAIRKHRETHASAEALFGGRVPRQGIAVDEVAKDVIQAQNAKFFRAGPHKEDLIFNQRRGAVETPHTGAHVPLGLDSNGQLIYGGRAPRNTEYRNQRAADLRKVRANRVDVNNLVTSHGFYAGIPVEDQPLTQQSIDDETFKRMSNVLPTVGSLHPYKTGGNVVKDKFLSLFGRQSDGSKKPPGRIRSAYNKLDNKLGGNLGYGLAAGAAFATSYAPAVAEHFTGTFQTKVGGSSDADVKRGRGIAGAVSGLGAGASAGFVAAGPWGAAVGGAIGALHGFVSATKEAADELRNINIEKNFKKLDNIFDDVTSGKKQAGFSTQGTVHNLLSQFDSQEADANKSNKYFRDDIVGRGLHSLFGAEGTVGSKERIEARKSFVQEHIAPRLGALNAYGENLASNIKITNPNLLRATDDKGNSLSPEELERRNQARIDQFKRVGGRDVAAKIVEADPTKTFESYYREMSRLIVESNNLRNQTKATAKALNSLEVETSKFSRITAAVDATVAAMGNLQTGVDSLASDFDNNLSATPVHSHVAAAQNFGGLDTESYNKAVGYVTGGISSASRNKSNDLIGEFGKSAIGINKAASVLPDVISRAHAEGGAIDGEGLASNISKGLQGEGIDEAIIAKIKNVLSGMKPEELGKEAGDNVQKLTDTLMKEGFANFNEVLANSAKALEENANNFNSQLIKYQDMVGKVGESEDRFGALQITAAKSALRVNAELVGRPGQPHLSTESEMLPIQSRQERLTGLQGGAANDPEQIASKLAATRAAITVSRQRVNTSNGKGQIQASSALAILVGNAHRLSQALNDLANPVEKNAILQEKLNRIEEERNSKLSFVEKYTTASSDERMQMHKNAYASDVAVTQGSLAGFNAEASRGALQHLSDLGEAKVYDGRKASDIRKQLVLNTGLQTMPGFVKPKEESERIDVMKQIHDNDEKAVEAQAHIIESQKGLQADFFNSLGRMQQEFFSKLATHFNEATKKDITAELGTTDDKLKRFNTSHRAKSSLNELGFSVDQAKSISSQIQDANDVSNKRQLIKPRVQQVKQEVADDVGPIAALASQAFHNVSNSGTPEQIKARSEAEVKLKGHLQERLQITPEVANQTVEHIRNSLVGFTDEQGNHQRGYASSVTGNVTPTGIKKSVFYGLNKTRQEETARLSSRESAQDEENAYTAFGGTPGTPINPRHLQAVKKARALGPVAFSKLIKDADVGEGITETGGELAKRRNTLLEKRKNLEQDQKGPEEPLISAPPVEVATPTIPFRTEAPLTPPVRSVDMSDKYRPLTWSQQLASERSQITPPIMDVRGATYGAAAGAVLTRHLTRRSSTATNEPSSYPTILARQVGRQRSVGLGTSGRRKRGTYIPIAQRVDKNLAPALAGAALSGFGPLTLASIQRQPGSNDPDAQERQAKGRKQANAFGLIDAKRKSDFQLKLRPTIQNVDDASNQRQSDAYKKIGASYEKDGQMDKAKVAYAKAADLVQKGGPSGSLTGTFQRKSVLNSNTRNIGVTPPTTPTGKAAETPVTPPTPKVDEQAPKQGNDVMSSFGQNLQALSGVIGNFDKSISNMGATLTNLASVFKDMKIPETIKVEIGGRQEVILNGAQLLASLQPNIAKMVTEAVMEKFQGKVPGIVKNMPPT